MNKKIKIIIAFTILFITVIPNIVFAKSTQNIFKLTEQKSIIVNVVWEKETPDVKLLSPDGSIFDITDKHNSDIKKIQYLINDAPKGQWGVKYDKKDNEYIDVYYEDYQYANNTENSVDKDEETEINKKTLMLFGTLAISTIITFSIIAGAILYYNKIKKEK